MCIRDRLRGRYTLLADKPFDAFADFNRVWLRLPVSGTNTNVDTAPDINVYDIDSRSIIEIPEDSLPFNPIESDSRLNSVAHTLDIAGRLSSSYSTPRLDTGSGISTSAEQDEGDYKWVAINFDYAHYTSNIPRSPFNNWGLIETIIQPQRPIRSAGRDTVGKERENEISIFLNSSTEIDIDDIKVRDWVYIPPKTLFNPRNAGGLIPDNAYVRDTIIGRVSEAFQFESGLRLKVVRFRINKELRNKWMPSKGVLYDDQANDKVIRVIRPNMRFSPKKDIHIRTSPETAYKFPVDVTLTYTEGKCGC